MTTRYIHNHKVLFEKYTDKCQCIPRIGESVYLDFLMLKVTNIQHLVLDDLIVVFLGE